MKRETDASLAVGALSWSKALGGLTLDVIPHTGVCA